MMRTINSKVRHILAALIAAVVIAAGVSVAEQTPASAATPAATCISAAAGVGCSTSQSLRGEACTGDAAWGLQMYIPPTSIIGFLSPIVNNVVNPILNIVNPILCAVFSLIMAPLATALVNQLTTGAQTSTTPKTTALPVSGWFDPSTSNAALATQNSGTFPTCGTGSYNQGNCYPMGALTSNTVTGSNTSTGGTFNVSYGVPTTVAGFSSNDASNTYSSSAADNNVAFGLGLPLLPQLGVVSIPTGTSSQGPISSTSCPTTASGTAPSYKATLSGNPSISLLTVPGLAPNGLISVSTVGVASSNGTVNKAISASILGVPILKAAQGVSTSALGLVVAGMSSDGSTLLTKFGLNTAALLTSLDPTGQSTSILNTTNVLGNVGVGLAISVGPGGRTTATTAEAWGLKVGVGPYFDLSLPLGLGYLGTGGVGASTGGVNVPFDRTNIVDVKYGYSSCRSSAATSSSSTLVASKAATPVGSGTVYPTGTTGITSGTKIDLKATVAPTSAGGTVQFYDGLATIGSPVTVSGGTATLAAYSFADGTHTLTSVFTPADLTKYSPSTSSPISVTLGSATVPAATPDLSQVGKVPPPNLK